ncbi:DoxX-like family protein [Streptomyces sp. NPDC059785]|uniref:DoxX-like family protein n=1 Tax=Streptomyces sp. NPDC059785 TaxID=3346945 RepID=UPI003652F55A
MEQLAGSDVHVARCGGRMAEDWRGAAARWAVALVWFYEGFWCKIWPGRTDQRAIVDGVPFLPDWALTAALVLIGSAEVLIGLWVLAGRRARSAAIVQTALVAVFNAGGLLFSPGRIEEPGRLLTQNLVFIVLIWTVSGTSPRPVAR